MAKGLYGFSDDIPLTPCRTCVENNGTRPVWGGLNSPDISLELTTICGVHLRNNDGLPQSICEKCFKLLEDAVLFRQSAKRSESILKRRISKLRKTQGSINPDIVKIEAISNNTEELEIKFVSVKDNDAETTDLNHYSTEVSKPESNFGELSLDETEIEVIEEAVDFDDEFEYNENIELQVNNDNEAVMLIVSDEEKASKKIKFASYCKLCNLPFDSEKELEQHRETTEHKRKYVISFLPKKRRKNGNGKQIDDNAKKTVHPKDQVCKICNRMFTKLHYPRHMQTQHKVSMITSRSNMKKECPVCRKMFHPVALPRHMKKIHVDEKDKPPKVKMECPVCKKLFSKDFYPLHMQRHNGDKNYVCDQCGQKFYFKSTFHTHRLIHSNNLPHKCSYCPYRGRTKSLLNTHVRTHTGDYPYQCTQCQTRCLTKSNLNAHMQRHRGPVDFICDTCNRGFYNKLDLERHVSVTHLGIKSHICNECGLTFGYRHGLTSHQVNVHKRAKREGKAKAVYLKLEEQGLLQLKRSNSDKEKLLI